MQTEAAELAIEKPTEEAPMLYDLSAESYEVAFNARPNSDNPQIVYHRLRKPTLDDLNQREQRITYEMVEMNSREEEIRSDDDAANSYLWDRLISSVKGYREAEDWCDVTDADKIKMRPGHKATAIRALYAGGCVIEGDENAVTIGPDTWTVRQDIGAGSSPDFVVRHTLREPTEGERVRFKRSSSSTSYVRGAKKSQVRIRTNLSAYVELYDALIQEVQGVTMSVPNLSLRAITAAISPVWKRMAIQCLMSALEAQLSD